MSRIHIDNPSPLKQELNAKQNWKKHTRHNLTVAGVLIGILAIIFMGIAVWVIKSEVNTRLPSVLANMSIMFSAGCLSTVKYSKTPHDSYSQLEHIRMQQVIPMAIFAVLLGVGTSNWVDAQLWTFWQFACCGVLAFGANMFFSATCDIVSKGIKE